MELIQREVYDWGVRLTVWPFEGDKNLGGMLIYSEIDLPKPNRGSVVKITFSAALAAAPLSVPDAQAWQNAFAALLSETRTIVGEMKAAKDGRAAKRKKK